MVSSRCSAGVVVDGCCTCRPPTQPRVGHLAPPKSKDVGQDNLVRGRSDYRSWQLLPEWTPRRRRGRDASLGSDGLSNIGSGQRDRYRALAGVPQLRLLPRSASGTRSEVIIFLAALPPLPTALFAQIRGTHPGFGIPSFAVPCSCFDMLRHTRGCLMNDTLPCQPSSSCTSCGKGWISHSAQRHC